MIFPCAWRADGYTLRSRFCQSKAETSHASFSRSVTMARSLPPGRKTLLVSLSLSLSLLIAVLAGSALAQTQITTGVIQGTVEDTSGAVLRGVQIEATSPDSPSTRSFTTGPDGRFVFLQMPPGRYTVTFKL